MLQNLIVLGFDLLLLIGVAIATIVILSLIYFIGVLYYKYLLKEARKNKYSKNTINKIKNNAQYWVKLPFKVIKDF